MTQTRKPRATLRRRMIVQLGLMLVCSLMIGLGAILGINSLRQDHDVSVQGYRQLRQVYEVGFQIATARDALANSPVDPARAQPALENALLKLQPAYYDAAQDFPTHWLDESRRDPCAAPLAQAIALLKQSDSSDGRARALSLINDDLGRLAMLSSEIRTTIVAHEDQANHKRTLMLSMVGALLVIVILAAVVIGTRQYVSVVGPLDRLGKGLRRFAAGNLSERIATDGDLEFAALADDFNQMANQLESLYRNLERQVEIKSRELMRSERLASVGYLAAGVAHEINNPLSIITGYGERSLRLLDGGMDETTVAKTRGTIRIICEEAFRCKEITGRLLSLARPGADDRRQISLGALADQVINNFRGLPEYADRKVLFASDLDEDFDVVVKDGEIRQVIINLLLNALQAVQPASGEVRIDLSRAEDEIELSVADNGEGMTPKTLDRVFEPFFTEKRGARPGMGLGLSIAHAIIADHGGRLAAQSAGPGLGSRFIVHLPAARKGVAHAAC